MSEEMKGFVLYKTQYKHITCLSVKQKAELLDAIYKYNLGEEIAFADSATQLVFGFIQDAMDLAADKWNKKHITCVENGRKGGLARLSEAKRTLTELSEAKQDLATLSEAKRILTELSEAKQGIARLSDTKHNNYNYNNDNDNDNNNDKKESTNVLKKEKRTNVVFQRPTIEEIEAYILEKKYTYTDAEKFFDFYESKNWFVGKNKMKDWKAAVRNWERTDKERHEPKQKSTPAKTTKREHPLKHEVIANELFSEFRKWQWQNIPGLMNRQPYFDDYIAFNQYCDLIGRFNPSGTDEGNAKAEQKIKDILLIIENRPDTYEIKYTSLYATVITWTAREK